MWQESAYGKAVLVTRSDRKKELSDNLVELMLKENDIEVINITENKIVNKYAQLLYKKLQRKGFQH